MERTIFIVGDIPFDDKQLFEVYSQHQNLSISFIDCLSDLPSFTSPPAGFISYYHCSIVNMTELFGALPIGTGEKIPFYQLINYNEIPDYLKLFPVMGIFQSPMSIATAYSLLASIARNIALAAQHTTLIKELINHRKQKFQLIQIGTSLSRENNLIDLLEIILSASRQIVSADAGSIYVRERRIPGGPFIDSLQFMVAQNDSVSIPKMTTKLTIPINENSVAGYVAKNAAVLNIEDVSNESELYCLRSVGKEMELKFKYRIKSMLTLPLKNMEGEIVGILQLMNKKRDPHLPINKDCMNDNITRFQQTDEDFIQSIASQAAVSIERVQLHESIRSLFEGFINASIAAIDERDKVTSGHSRRVMEYAKAFSEKAAEIPNCQYACIAESKDRQRQFEFAALLHDIGKIGVPEYLLTKEHRLSDQNMSVIIARTEIALFQIDSKNNQTSWNTIDELKADLEFISKINCTGYLNQEDLEYLVKIKNKTFFDASGNKMSILTEKDFESLSVKYGNLTDNERMIINSHAKSTYRILSLMPWPRQLELVPLIASQHHEKLDGSGYPDGVKNEKITLESKILAVVDIYEALVAQNRPYKPRISPENAIEILRFEAEKGHLDRDIVEFFYEKGIYLLFNNQ